MFTKKIELLHKIIALLSKCIQTTILASQLVYTFTAKNSVLGGNPTKQIPQRSKPTNRKRYADARNAHQATSASP